MTTDNFIVKSKEIFNNPNWDYSETKYNEYVKDLDIPYFNTTDELINYIKKKQGYESSI